MSVLTVTLILAMLLWSVGFVVVGLVRAEEVRWRRPAGQAGPPVSRTRKLGAMGLLAIGGDPRRDGDRGGGAHGGARDALHPPGIPARRP